MFLFFNFLSRPALTLPCEQIQSLLDDLDRTTKDAMDKAKQKLHPFVLSDTKFTFHKRYVKGKLSLPPSQYSIDEDIDNPFRFRFLAFSIISFLGLNEFAFDWAPQND